MMKYFGGKSCQATYPQSPSLLLHMCYPPIQAQYIYCHISKPENHYQVTFNKLWKYRFVTQAERLKRQRNKAIGNAVLSSPQSAWPLDRITTKYLPLHEQRSKPLSNIPLYCLVYSSQPCNGLLQFLYSWVV